MAHEDNVFGLPVTVASQQELLNNLAAAGNEPVVYVVSRCIDLPASQIPPIFRARNRKTTCDKCGELCWIDPKYAVPGVRVLCTPHCLPKDSKAHATDEQVAEMRRIFRQH